MQESTTKRDYLLERLLNQTLASGKSSPYHVSRPNWGLPSLVHPDNLLDHRVRSRSEGAEHHFVVAACLAAVHDVLVVLGVRVRARALVLERARAVGRALSRPVHVLAAVPRRPREVVRPPAEAVQVVDGADDGAAVVSRRPPSARDLRGRDPHRQVVRILHGE